MHARGGENDDHNITLSADSAMLLELDTRMFNSQQQTIYLNISKNVRYIS